MMTLSQLLALMRRRRPHLARELVALVVQSRVHCQRPFVASRFVVAEVLICAYTLLDSRPVGVVRFRRSTTAMPAYEYTIGDDGYMISSAGRYFDDRGRFTTHWCSFGSLYWHRLDTDFPAVRRLLFTCRLDDDM